MAEIVAVAVARVLEAEAEAGVRDGVLAEGGAEAEAEADADADAEAKAETFACFSSRSFCAFFFSYNRLESGSS